MAIADNMRLNLNDYNMLLEVLDKVPLAGLQTHRAAAMLEQKLLYAAKAAAEAAQNPNAEPITQPPGQPATGASENA